MTGINSVNFTSRDVRNNNNKAPKIQSSPQKPSIEISSAIKEKASDKLHVFIDNLLFDLKVLLTGKAVTSKELNDTKIKHQREFNNFRNAHGSQKGDIYAVLLAIQEQETMSSAKKLGRLLRR